MSHNHPIEKLLAIMSKLRDPDGGCPWDLEQTFETIAPHTVEEAYEVAEAIADNDMVELKSELGDLMFQVVFYAQMAKENGDFDFNGVIEAISEKMIHRHPHVFGDRQIATADAQTVAWEETKAAERAAKAKGNMSTPSALDGVAKTLPPMTRALKIQNRASRVGFDWQEVDPIYDKIAEELSELKHEIHSNAPKERLLDEYGDILFAVVNLGRHLQLDPEMALSSTTRKFTRRFQQIEERLQKVGKNIVSSDLDEMHEIWNEVKAEEKVS